MLPGVQPRLGDDREPLTPLLVEGLELGLGLVGVDGGVDRLQVAGDLLTLAARHVLEAVADQVHDARLHGRLREDRLDRVGEPGEPVDTRDQDVLHAALLEIGQDLHPELRALGLLEPHAQHITVAVQRDAEGEVERAALHAAAVADLEHHAVEEHDWVDVLQRPLAPVANVVHHAVGHAADEVAADLHTVDLLEVRGYVARRQSPGVEREDLVVEPLKAALAFADDLRLKAAVTVAGRVDLDLPVLGDQRLRCRAVARVPRAAGRLLVRLVADVVGQLDLHRALHEALGQLGEQPAGPGDLLLRRGAGEQLVDHLVADPPVGRHPESLPQAAAASSTIHRLIDHPGRGVRRERAAPGLPSANVG